MKLMNKKFLAALALLPVITLAAPSQFEANVPVDHVYSPAGFDSNDNSEIVVTGFLPNLCYKAPKASVAVNNGKISVEVKALRTATMGFCAQVIVPYIEYISIGVLGKGNYQIAVNEKTSWEKKSNLFVADAVNNTIDDVVYANVEEVVKAEDGSRKVALKGNNPSNCFELKEIKVLDNGVDTYSILPIMKQVKTYCPKIPTAFNYEFEVPEKLDADRILLHVRVMDGRSVNAFYSNKPLEE
jgi:hypothetical protein